MATFSPKTPEPGWERRWVREAWGLIRDTPDVLVVMIGVSAVGGFIRAATASDRVGLLVSSAVTVTLACFLFSPLIAWGYSAIGKREGYVSGGFSGYDESVRMSMKTGLFVLMAFVCVWSLTSALSDPAEAQDPIKRITASSVLYFGADGLAQGFIFGWAGMFRHLTVAMVGGSPDENRMISRRAHEKLISVFPKVTTYVMVAFFATVTLPGPLVIAVYLAFFYWLYVAGREIIGGITGNRKTEENRVRVLGAA